MIFQIIKNNVPEKYFELYMVESDIFLFKDNLTGDKIGDGFILLKIILNNIKPSTGIDVQGLEDKLTSAILPKYKINVLSCTGGMEKLYKEIRRLKPGTYDDNRFLTQFFRALQKTTDESFERTVEVVKDKYILGDKTCMVAYVIKTCSTKYLNLECSNIWNKSSNKDIKIIDLTTELNDQRMKFEEFHNNYNNNGNKKLNSMKTIW